MQKKAAILQDISCLGKCSAGVALPIVSHFNIECALLPTALLSAHTAFPTYTCMDLTDMMRKTMQDWRSLDVCFDGFYSGYMLNCTQIALAETLLDTLCRDDTFVLVDPVMGYNGKAYAMLSEAYAADMRRLVSRADIITPNLTEAALLLNRPPKLSGYTEADIRELLLSLHAQGAKCPIITGVSYAPESIGAAYLENGVYHYISDKRFDHVFCGTGDTFAAVVFAAMLQGSCIKDAVTLALRVLRKAMEGEPQWYGINFEAALCDGTFLAAPNN